MPARAMGAVGIETSNKLSQARRLVAPAEKYQMEVVKHNHKHPKKTSLKNLCRGVCWNTEAKTELLDPAF